MAVSLPDTTTLATSTQQEVCANCGANLIGNFCHQCGQKRIHRHEFSLKHFIAHLIHEITHFDSNKVLKTFFALLFKPGLLTSEYLAGRKGRYINPIRLYLTFSALYFLFAWGTLADVRGTSADRTARNPALIAMAQAKGMEPKALAEKVVQKAEKYAAALRFASVLISGLFLSVLYFPIRRYYVEHLIFSLNYYSFDFFFKSVFALLFLLATAVGFKLPSMALNLFYPIALLYLLFALRRVYRQSWPQSVWKALILFVCETLLFIIVNIAGFVIAFALV
jgi:hypothetical protein